MTKMKIKYDPTYEKILERFCKAMARESARLGIKESKSTTWI